MSDVEIRHFHLFCGIGAGARGFNRGQARVGTLEARFRCLGGIDVDPAAARDFARLAGAPCSVIDLFDRHQYEAFHGREPPADWRPAGPEAIRRAAGGERPHIVFLSAPCKGFSGLLSESMSGSAKYQALNRLTLRGVGLMLEAWADDPPELVIFENVPRIATRGRPLLDRIGSLLGHYGYAVAETTHDCGRLGGLAQSRKRFLLVARHREKVPPFLYEPPQRALRGVGEVLERLPLPGDPLGGPMHRIPSLQWKTWVRLAFVEAGSDWRSLKRLRVAGGVLEDYGIAAEGDWHNGALGVTDWAETSGTVTGNGRPMSGRFSVGDPRIAGHERSVQMGVRRWGQPAGVVTGKMFVGGGPNAVADPRMAGPDRFSHCYRILPWGAPGPAVTSANAGTAAAVADPRAPDGRHAGGKYRVTSYGEVAGAVIAGSTTGNGAFAVADPRTGWAGAYENKLAVRPWDVPAKTVTGSDRVGSGAMSVADPRPVALSAEGRTAYLTGGHYGVVRWEESCGAVPAAGQHDNGRWSVADPRAAEAGEEARAGQGGGLPAPEDRLACIIRALDGTWHRPFTTLELAALQSLVDPEEQLELDGLSDAAWRERIGNAVPPDAAQAIASVMGRTLLLAWTGESFLLSSAPIWVQPVAAALAVETPLLPRLTKGAAE